MERSVHEWIDLLLAKIDAQRVYAKPYEDRYQNRYTLPFLQREYSEVYGSSAVHGLLAIQPPRAGVASVVVDAYVERMTVLGAQSEDADAAKLVERAWLASDLDVMHREAHRESLIKRTAFGVVSRAADQARAIVSVESAEQMAVHRMPGPPYDVDAALKVWTDEWTGRRHGYLWLPGVEYALIEARAAVVDPRTGVRSQWVLLGEPRRSGLPGVPVVEFPAQSRLLVDPVSEIEPIVSHVDIIDLIEGLMVFAGHFGAVPIRWATGLVVEEDEDGNPVLDASGKPKIGFNPRADHLWGSTNEKAQFGQLTPASLESFVAWAQHAAMRIRSKTGIASTYLSLDLKSHMSAELLKTDEAPMVRRVLAKGKHGTYGQAWRRIMQLILQVESPAMASKVTVLPRWENPQTRIESQEADIFAKLAPSLGVSTLAQKILGWSKADAEAAVAEAAQAKAQGDPDLQRALDMIGMIDDGAGDAPAV